MWYIKIKSTLTLNMVYLHLNKCVMLSANLVEKMLIMMILSTDIAAHWMFQHVHTCEAWPAGAIIAAIGVDAASIACALPCLPQALIDVNVAFWTLIPAWILE